MARTDKRYTKSDTIRVNFEIDKDDPYMAPTLMYPPASGYTIRSDDDRPDEWNLFGPVNSPLAIENERFSVTLYSSYCTARIIDFTSYTSVYKTGTDDQCPF